MLLMTVISLSQSCVQRFVAVVVAVVALDVVATAAVVVVVAAEESILAVLAGCLNPESKKVTMGVN